MKQCSEAAPCRQRTDTERPRDGSVVGMFEKQDSHQADQSVKVVGVSAGRGGEGCGSQAPGRACGLVRPLISCQLE